MPSLPKPRFVRTARGRGSLSPALAEPETSQIEVIEASGIRWVNIEQPRHAHRAWLEERFDFHPLDYEDVFSRNQRPKIDEYDEYLFIVLYFPVFDKTVGRLNAAELDMFVGPDFLITWRWRCWLPARSPTSRICSGVMARDAAAWASCFSSSSSRLPGG